MRSEIIAFVDVEASGLGPTSFPIEVGWALSSGESGSWLIAPACGWDVSSWDENAEGVHGISLSDLATGLKPWAAAELLDRALRDARTVLSDAPGVDENWISMLFEEAPWERSFLLKDFQYSFQRRFGYQHYLPDDARVHRAGADAAQLRDHWAAAARLEPKQAQGEFGS